MPSEMRTLEQDAADSAENQSTATERLSQWFLLFWVIVGVGLDWRCAFESFAGKYSLYSALVLGRTVLIVLACAGSSFLAVRVIQTRRRDAWLLFSVFSMAVYRVLSNHWIATRR